MKGTSESEVSIDLTEISKGGSGGLRWLRFQVGFTSLFFFFMFLLLLHPLNIHMIRVAFMFLAIAVVVVGVRFVDVEIVVVVLHGKKERKKDQSENTDRRPEPRNYWRRSVRLYICVRACVYETAIPIDGMTRNYSRIWYLSDDWRENEMEGTVLMLICK